MLVLNCPFFLTQAQVGSILRGSRNCAIGWRHRPLGEQHSPLRRCSQETTRFLLPMADCHYDWNRLGFHRCHIFASLW